MKKIILPCFLACLHVSLFAQTLTTTQTDQLKAFATDKGKAFGQTNFTPFGTSAFSNFLSNISASASFEKGVNGKAELRYTSQNWLTAGFSVDQKIGKNSTEATPIDLFEGISPGTTMKFNLQKMFWNPLLTQAEFNRFDAAANAFATRTGVDRRIVTLSQILANGTKAEIDQASTIKLKQPLFLNFEAAFTKTSFAYTTDSFSLRTNKETHVTPTVSLFVGIPFSITSFLAFGYKYAEAYDAADDVSFISRFGTSTNLFTQTLAFGAPQKKTDNVLSAEWRIGFGQAGKPSSFSIGPTVHYGLESKQLAASLPVYFINGKNSSGKLTGLQGGVRIRYATSTEAGKGASFKEGFSTQLIVTAPFDIFGNL